MKREPEVLRLFAFIKTGKPAGLENVNYLRQVQYEKFTQITCIVAG